MKSEDTEPIVADAPAAAVPTTAEPLHPEIIDNGASEGDEDGTFVSEPARLIRIASMTRAMLEEVRQSELDEAGRARLLQIYATSMDQLRESLSDDLAAEMDAMFGPLEGPGVSKSELRIVQAQLVGWLEGLFHGIQASIFSQQAAAAAQLEEMRRRRALESRDGTAGQYL